jgi:adenosine kinase
MPALICGSLAYDTIMVFPDRFRDHILPEQMHILNVSFLVPQLRREFGGVAGNIAYNLKLLGGDPYPMGAVGDDFDPYQEHLETLGISTRHVRRISGTYTPQAYITTDMEDNQITAFHPGAMEHNHLNHVADSEGIKIGIIAPDSKQAMLQFSQEFPKAGIPHIFDPGQAMTQFDGDDLREFIANANWIVANDYEFKLLQERSGMGADEIAREVWALVVTRGAEGSMLYEDSEVTEIPAARAKLIADPTGCGDAYRAGVLYGILNDMDLPTACRIGAVLGAIKIEHEAPQHHKPERQEIEDRFEEAYGYRF